jgi:hypothetical protein
MKFQIKTSFPIHLKEVKEALEEAKVNQNFKPIAQMA